MEICKFSDIDLLDYFLIFSLYFVAKLLEVLIRCVEETDIDRYESEITKYEAVMRFEPWYKKLLEKIRNNMIVCGYDLC